MDQHSNIFPKSSFYLEKCIQNRKRLLDQQNNKNFNRQSPCRQDNSEQSINQIEPLQNQTINTNIKQNDNSSCNEIQESKIQQMIENNQSNKKKILIQFKFTSKLSQQIKSNQLSNLSDEQSTIDIDQQVKKQNQNTVETQTDLIYQENLEKDKHKPKFIDSQCQSTEDIPIQNLIIQKMKEDALKPNKQWYSINLNSSIHTKLLMNDKFMSDNKVAIDYFDCLKNTLDES